MHLRRTTALPAAVLLLAVPTLASCTADYAVNRPYTVAAGTNNRDGSVDVLGAVIVSAQDNAGTFIAALSNNDQTKSVKFESMAGASGTTVQFKSFSPRTIGPGGMLNLAQEGGVQVTGTFKAGDVLPVSLRLSNGEQVTMDVPVVVDDGDFAGYDKSATGSSESASPSGSASPSESASPSDGSSASPSSSPSE